MCVANQHLTIQLSQNIVRIISDYTIGNFINFEQAISDHDNKLI